MNRQVFLFLALALVAIGCWSGTSGTSKLPKPGEVVVREGQVPVVGLTGDEQGIIDAKKKAQDGLPHFIEELQKAKKGDYFAIKVPIATSISGEFEHIWIDQLVHSGSSFKGALGNEPLDIPGKKLGSPVEVKDSDVEDWVITRANGSLEGGFSVDTVRDAAKG